MRSRRNTSPIVVLTLFAGAALLAAAIGGTAWAGCGSCGPAATTATEQPLGPAKPALLAIAFHADSCGSCRKLGPKMADARKQITDQPVLFVKFDLTDKHTARQAEYMAAALGVGKVWAKHHHKTGYALLVDAATGKPVDELTADLSADEIAATLSSAVATAGKQAKACGHCAQGACACKG
jgi:hypothetical protein